MEQKKKSSNFKIVKFIGKQRDRERVRERTIEKILSDHKLEVSQAVLTLMQTDNKKNIKNI